MSSNVVTLPQKGIMSLVDQNHLSAVESALAMNDLSKLSTEQRISYYNAVCESVGLNPLTQPFAYITLDGRLTLYARKECSEQLRKLNAVSTQIIEKNESADFYEVHVRAGDKSGRFEEDFASVYLYDKYNKKLTGNALANAKMKCVTKAKRRVTLAISGLGVLDESELETISPNSIEKAINPQIKNPFKQDDETIAMDIKPVEIDFSNKDLGSYIVTFGKKLSGKQLKDINLDELRNYIYEYLEKGAAKNNKPLTGAALELFEKGDAYIRSLEAPQFDENEDMPE